MLNQHQSSSGLRCIRVLARRACSIPLACWAPIPCRHSSPTHAHTFHQQPKPFFAVTHLLLRLGSAAVADPRVAELLYPLLMHATNLGGWVGRVGRAGLTWEAPLVQLPQRVSRNACSCPKM